MVSCSAFRSKTARSHSRNSSRIIWQGAPLPAKNVGDLLGQGSLGQNPIQADSGTVIIECESGGSKGTQAEGSR